MHNNIQAKLNIWEKKDTQEYNTFDHFEEFHTLRLRSKKSYEKCMSIIIFVNTIVCTLNDLQNILFCLLQKIPFWCLNTF